MIQRFINKVCCIKRIIFSLDKQMVITGVKVKTIFNLGRNLGLMYGKLAYTIVLSFMNLDIYIYASYLYTFLVF